MKFYNFQKGARGKIREEAAGERERRGGGGKRVGGWCELLKNG